MQLDKTFWDSRYQNNETGWDIGFAATPLVDYFSQLKDKSIKILIPGAGNAYEAEWLHKNGFINTHVLDISSEAVANFKKRVPTFAMQNVHLEDFFSHQSQYYLIVEQTFFCALNPGLRESYVNKMAELLKPGGKLVGLLFDDPLNDDHPPFGGRKEEYEKLLNKRFELKVMETAKNSIAPRQGRELFFIAIKK
jgi:SAM-dependent methyltransferase